MVPTNRLRRRVDAHAAVQVLQGQNSSPEPRAQLPSCLDPAQLLEVARLQLEPRESLGDLHPHAYTVGRLR